LALTRLDPANLLYFNIPFADGQPFDPSLWGLIFGVILLAFFGHMSVNNCAQVVLRRDASARSLIGGAVAALVVVIALYSIWCVAVAGAVPADTLAAETGTILAPLAGKIGPSAVLLSSIFVILALAMGSIHSSLGLYNLVRERLPTQASLSVRLPLREGRLVLAPRRTIRDLFRAGPQTSRLAVTYVGLDGAKGRTAPRPRLRLDLTLGSQVHVFETTLEGASWDESALAGGRARVLARGRVLPPAIRAAQAGASVGGRPAETPLTPDSWAMELLRDLGQRGMHLKLEVVEAAPAHIYLRVVSSMAMRYEGERESAGFDLAALLETDDAERHLWNWLSRQPEPISLAEIAAGARVDEDTAQELVNALVRKRLVIEDVADGQLSYRARFAPRRSHRLPEALSSEGASPRMDQRTSPARWANLNAGERYGLCALPTVAAFLLTEYLILSGTASFAGALSLIGVLLASLLGGFFPVLLLVASRRKGDVVPGVAPRLIGHPLVLALIYLLYLAGLLMHGLIIWQEPVERIAALGVALLGVVMPIVTLRSGAFRRRAVIELYAPPDGKGAATFATSATGRFVPTEVSLHYDQTSRSTRAATGEIPDFAALRSASFRWQPQPEGGASERSPAVRDIKVWAHALAPDGSDQALQATGELGSGGVVTRYDLGSLGGQVVLPLAGEGFAVQVALAGLSLRSVD
jgi:hypothetical protein